MGRHQRETVTIACLFLLLTIAISRKDDGESFAPESYSFLFDSEEGVLFFSDDEEQERIIAALVDSKGISSSGEESVNELGDEDRNEDARCDMDRPVSNTAILEAPTPASPAIETMSVFNKPKLEPRYEYLQLPDVYRVNATAKIPAKRSNQRFKKVAVPNTKEPVIYPGDDSYAQASPWVQNFLLRHSHDVLLPVPRDFCMDNFNLMHIAPSIERIGIQSLSSDDTIPVSSKPYPIYREALRLIVHDEPLPENVPLYLQNAATALYLLIHQRYVLSPRGLDMLRRRFLKGSSANPIFGRCPRIQCSGMPLLPHADSDNLNPMEYCLPEKTKDSMNDDPLSVSFQMTRRSKRYCASCGETLYHWDSELDGCAWGTSCCHLFLMVYGKEIFAEWCHNWKPQSHSPSEARIFGFRLHSSAHDSHTQTGL